MAVDPASGDVCVVDSLDNLVEKFNSGLTTCCAVSTSTGEGLATQVQLDCSDANGLPLSYAIDSGPSHGVLGSIDQSTGQVTYTPTGGFTGADSFTYHATSANGTAASQTVSITVNPPPACEDAFLTTAAGRTATARLSCVDSANAALSYAIVSAPSHGTLGLLHQLTGQVAYHAGRRLQRPGQLHLSGDERETAPRTPPPST